MAQARTMNTKQRKLTPWQNVTSNGRFNNGLPPTRRHLQHYVISNAGKTCYPNIHMRTCQSRRNRH